MRKWTTCAEEYEIFDERDTSCDPDDDLCCSDEAIDVWNCMQDGCPEALVCIEAPPASVGAACAEDTDCGDAPCVELDGSAFCSSPCLLGSQIGCEAFGSDVFCLVPIAGDPRLGFCTELCDEPTDCTQAGYVCELLTEPLPNGRTGTCLPPLPAAP